MARNIMNGKITASVTPVHFTGFSIAMKDGKPEIVQIERTFRIREMADSDGNIKTDKIPTLRKAWEKELGYQVQGFDWKAFDTEYYEMDFDSFLLSATKVNKR